MKRTIRNRVWLGVGGLLIALLLAAVVTLGSLGLPFELHQWTQVLVLYAVSAFVVAALLVFGLILTRTALRLWLERRAQRLGARFKTKMVLGAMAISLLPVVFMFVISYGLLNRSLARWFPRPLEVATEESQRLLSGFIESEKDRLFEILGLAIEGKDAQGQRDNSPDVLERALHRGAAAAWISDSSGLVLRGLASPRVYYKYFGALLENKMEEISPRRLRSLSQEMEVWEDSYCCFLAVNREVEDQLFYAARYLSPEFVKQYSEIQQQLAAYEAQKQQYRAYKTQMVLYLLLFTVLLMFAAVWFALFLSKQVTVPIEALSEGTKRVSAGEFGHRVEVHAHDELGALVGSFNEMTGQLASSRAQIEEFTRNLQLAVQELERRRKLMEAVLENIPTGVISLDDTGHVTRLNPAAVNILGEKAREARSLAELLGEEAARVVQQLIRKSQRLGAASKALEIAPGGRVVHAAVTVSSLGPRRSNPGFVVVVDDLTDLLRAQKASAWQEVAQRIAHEIKNPLTPIQLSAQRLARQLERQRAGATQPGAALPQELETLVSECALLIQREVAVLETLVDEFSQFARFPTARLVPADANAIVTSALEVFGGRLNGIDLRTELADAIPAIKADPELLLRVVVNLIDNAAEALEDSTVREIQVRTRASSDGETVEISVADSGHGISPEDKDKLFLPHFSTKERGTGLGLAIAARIVEEHGGAIRVEDNSPMGSRFVIVLPVAEVTAL